MRATDHAAGASRDIDVDQARSATQDRQAGQDRRGPRIARWAEAEFRGSWAEDLWVRLCAVDFMNESILLAATFLLCAVPFMIVADALAGRSATTTLALRLGLSHQAATDVGHLFASSSAVSAAVTGTSWVFFILGGLAAATTVQALYRKIFQVQPGRWDRLSALGWLALIVGLSALGTVTGHGFSRSQPVLWWIVAVPGFIGFWWFTMWLLVGGKVAWRRLLPCAVATGLFWIGMLVVFHFTFSTMVTGSDRQYGPIGVVFDLMSFFIAIGVVITLGAATGMMWHDRGLSLRAAVRKVPGAS